MKKLLAVVIIILSIGMTISSSTGVNVTEQSTVTSFDGNHPPIYIEGNANFTHENGVTGGSGTEEDPFIIEDWIIVNDSTTDNGIFINNTDVYFVIKNCTVSNFTDIYDEGILLNNVKNGAIYDTTTYRNQQGIGLQYCNNIIIYNCTSYNYSTVWFSSGISCYICSDITISSFYCYDKERGIHLSNTSNIVIEDYLCHDIGTGIDSWAPSDNLIIRDCEIFNISDTGINLFSTGFKLYYAYSLIQRCKIYNIGSPNWSGMDGISISNLFGCIIEDCDVYDSYSGGILISLAVKTTIRNCSIHNTTYGIQFAPGTYRPLLLGEYSIIENCDIYDNRIGIFQLESVKSIIRKNNIYSNILSGLWILKDFRFLLSAARVNNNNIFGNGFYYENYSLSVDCWRSFVDLRHNWWGDEKGPRMYRLGRRGKLYPIRTEGDGDTIYRFRSIIFYRPWATEPIPDAGRQ